MSKAKHFKRGIYIGLLLGCFFVIRAESYRKCYLVAYEANAAYKRGEVLTDIRSVLKNMFNNKRPVTKAAIADTLFSGINCADMFDPEKDEIIFYTFGTYPEKYRCRDIAYPKPADGVPYFNRFLSDFIRMEYRYSGHGGPVGQFLDSCFSTLRPDASGATLSHFVFPLIFLVLPERLVAQEYYLITLTDYNTSAITGYEMDYKNFKVIMQESIDGGYSKIKRDLLDPLYGSLLADEQFKYIYEVYPFPGRSIIERPGLFGYAIRTKSGTAGKYGSDVVLDSPVILEQTKYGSDEFLQNEVRIVFAHNERLTIDSLVCEMIAGRQDTVCRAAVQPACYRYENPVYTVAPVVFRLDEGVRLKEFDRLRVNYRFYTSQRLTDSLCADLHTIHTVSQLLPASAVLYHTAPVSRNWWMGVTAFLVASGLCVWIGRTGLLRKVEVRRDGFLDHFTDICNYKKEEFDYYAWTEKTKEVRYCLVFVPVFRWFVFWKWKYKICVSAEFEDEDQSGLCFSVRGFRVEGNERNSFELPLTTQSQTEDDFRVTVMLTKTPGAPIDVKNKIYRFRVTICWKVKYRGMGWIKRSVSKKLSGKDIYEFLVGEPLGPFWIGLDPGTTGSAMAFGRSAKHIFLSKALDDARKLIEVNNSVVLFDRVPRGKCTEWKPGEDYYYGFNAFNRLGMENVVGFRSMKKLLGYNTEHSIEIAGNRVCKLTGRQVFMLLLKGLHKDLLNYVNSSLTAEEKRKLQLDQNPFLPRRVVLAVPNSFSMRRIQDMRNCIVEQGLFRQILFVYETDAILFYCIEKRMITDDSYIIIFDMGGATINLSCYHLATGKEKVDGQEKKRYEYEVDMLGRIGYGIGGDTIDFFIIDKILNFKEVKSAFKRSGTLKGMTTNQYRNKNVSKLLDLAFDIKCEIIKNFNEKSEYLITARLLGELISEKLGVIVKIEEDSAGYREFLKSYANPAPLLDDQLNDLVYGSVVDAVNELVAFRSVCALKEKPVFLLFAGRSVTFPWIKVLVENALKSKGFNHIKTWPEAHSLNDLKTIVAEGACWYGLKHQKIKIDNNKCFYSVYLLKPASGGGEKAEFVPVIESEAEFKDEKIERTTREGILMYGADDRYVEIYQVVGNKPDELYKEEDRKHKMSLIASMEATTPVEKVGVVLENNDRVSCTLYYTNQVTYTKQGTIHMPDIAEENAEHYTFAAMYNSNVNDNNEEK